MSHALGTWMYTPNNHQLKNSQMLDVDLVEPSTTRLRTFWLRAGCWLVFCVLCIFTDVSLGRFDCVDFIHTHHL